MEKILVTGGLGIIGSFVCRALLTSSRMPVVYDLSSDYSLMRDIASDCLIERGDVCDLPCLLSAIAEHKPVAIIHLAGRVGPSVEQNPWSSLSSNLIANTTVFEAARLSGVQRIIYPSSRQVYGPVAETHRHPNYEALIEDHPREPVIFYGKLKRAVEDIADHYARLYGLDIIALRLASSIGPGGHSKLRDASGLSSPVIGLIESAIANRPFEVEFGADQSDDLCYSGEAANGFLAALSSVFNPGQFRAYNIGSGELISLRGMVEVLRDLYPSWCGKVGPGLDYRRLGLGYYFKMSTQKAKVELGFIPAFDFRRTVIDYAQTSERLGKITNK